MSDERKLPALASADTVAEGLTSAALPEPSFGRESAMAAGALVEAVGEFVAGFIPPLEILRKAHEKLGAKIRDHKNLQWQYGIATAVADQAHSILHFEERLSNIENLASATFQHLRDMARSPRGARLIADSVEIAEKSVEVEKSFMSGHFCGHIARHGTWDSAFNDHLFYETLLYELPAPALALLCKMPIVSRQPAPSVMGRVEFDAGASRALGRDLAIADKRASPDAYAHWIHVLCDRRLVDFQVLPEASDSNHSRFRCHATKTGRRLAAYLGQTTRSNDEARASTSTSDTGEILVQAETVGHLPAVVDGAEIAVPAFVRLRLTNQTRSPRTIDRIVLSWEHEVIELVDLRPISDAAKPGTFPFDLPPGPSAIFEAPVDRIIQVLVDLGIDGVVDVTPIAYDGTKHRHQGEPFEIDILRWR